MLHEVSLTDAATSSEWTELLPSETRSVNGGEVMAVSGDDVVVP